MCSGDQNRDHIQRRNSKFQTAVPLWGSGLGQLLAIALATCLAGCFATESTEEARQLDSFNSKSTAIASYGSLCDLVKSYRAGAGEFVVEKITQNPQKHPGKTFVDLDRKKVWYSNKSISTKVNIVFPEGPTKGGGYETGPSGYPDLKVGQRIGALLYSSKISGREFIIFDTGTFVPDGNGYTNGKLFEGTNTSLTEIKKKVVDMNSGIETGDGVRMT